MRGKENLGNTEYSYDRITPAYAGKSNHVADVYRIEWDHPRLCGEKVSLLHQKCSILGSPPPMRGKVPLVTSIAIVMGITPAYAGKSANSEPITLDVEDHPRLCGEKTGTLKPNSLIEGSPPPMRGKVQNRFRSLCSVGITPAYAGKRAILSPVNVL